MMHCQCFMCTAQTPAEECRAVTVLLGQLGIPVSDSPCCCLSAWVCSEVVSQYIVCSLTYSNAEMAKVVADDSTPHHAAFHVLLDMLSSTHNDADHDHDDDIFTQTRVGRQTHQSA